jgi:hypothetical protein
MIPCTRGFLFTFINDVHLLVLLAYSAEKLLAPSELSEFKSTGPR